MNMSLSQELAWRGFANQTTLKDVTALDSKSFTFYFGVDPSADSMQIGNLAAAMMVRHFINHGHKAILLVGGATGMIGDPDGKKQERDLKTVEEIAKNKKAIIAQYEKIFAGQGFEIVDNYEWFKKINYLDFLREIGKHVPMRQMLGRDFVQSRLSENGTGISYAEFSYSLIQGFDFLHLYREKGVTMQLCGADQWGNSIAGVDLIRRLTGGEAHIWSAPLVVNKTTGMKFGKSEDGAVWLDPRKTSIFRFYQFWLNADDEGAIDYLKIFTLLSKDIIEDIAHKFSQDRASRLAQKTLAFEVTKLIHGEDAANEQVRIAEALFGRNLIELSDQEFGAIAQDFPVANVPKRLSTDDLHAAIVETGLASSKSEARRFLLAGAIYINNLQLTASEEFSYDMHNRFAVIRRGKNTTALLKVK